MSGATLSYGLRVKRTVVCMPFPVSRLLHLLIDVQQGFRRAPARRDVDQTYAFRDNVKVVKATAADLVIPFLGAFTPGAGTGLSCPWLAGRPSPQPAPVSHLSNAVRAVPEQIPSAAAACLQPEVLGEWAAELRRGTKGHNAAWRLVLFALAMRYAHGMFTQLAYRMHVPGVSGVAHCLTFDVGFLLTP